MASAGLGGVVLYGRNVQTRDRLADLSAALHAERPGLLIAIDEEGGDVTRLEAKEGSSYPGNLALGAADDRSLTFDVAASIGYHLAEVGIDLDLAPVADVNTNPLNPVIGVRSFGSDPFAVAKHTSSWITGLQSEGVAACAKHFPGHGDTSVDSHLALPVVNEDPHLRALRPFVAAIASGVQAIMSAHIVVPPIDDVPGTISSRIMTGLLRDELGFRGLAITDGLEMRGLSDGRGVAEGAVLALVAGCDALCIGGGLAGEDVVREIVRAVEAALKAGRLTEHRLEQAAARVDSVAEWRSGQGGKASVSRQAGLVAARRAVCSDGPVRIRDEAVVIQFASARSIAAGDVSWGIAASLAARGTAAAHRAQPRPIRLPARTERQRAPNLHDAPRHAVRRDVHGSRAGASSRRSADNSRAARGGRTAPGAPAGCCSGRDGPASLSAEGSACLHRDVWLRTSLRRGSR